MADRTLSLEATPVQKGWYLHNTHGLDPFHIHPSKFHLMKSSSEVEEKHSELVSRFVWIHGARARSTHRVIHLHSIKSAPRPSALAQIFLFNFLVVDSVFVATFSGGWFSPRNSWSALHSSDKFEKIVFSLTSDWSKMGTGSLGNLSKLQICEVC